MHRRERVVEIGGHDAARIWSLPKRIWQQGRMIGVSGNRYGDRPARRQRAPSDTNLVELVTDVISWRWPKSVACPRKRRAGPPHEQASDKTEEKKEEDRPQILDADDLVCGEKT